MVISYPIFMGAFKEPPRRKDRMADTVVAQLPSPPHKNVFREWSGGMGTALPSERPGYGHDQKFYDIPFSAYLYIARRLETAGISLRYLDLQSRGTIELDEFDSLIA